MKSEKKPTRPTGPNIFAILKPYLRAVLLLAALTIAANGLSLWVPKIISHAIDAYIHGTLKLNQVGWELGWFALGVFVLTYVQNIIQVFVSEKVAMDLRNTLSAKISLQSYTFVQETSPSKLLTNLTSDIDAIKTFVATAIASLISSVVLIIGASILLLATNWRLALVVLLIVPIIGVTFFLMLRKVRAYFLKSREVIDQLNRVINESILGAALIRVLNSSKAEHGKFSVVNKHSQDIGLQIIRVFSALIPIIGFVANLATLTILTLGGHFVIQGSMSLGDFAAFNTYILILIFPIIIIGFMSNLIAQASASYGRVVAVLEAPEPKPTGTRTETLKGDIEVKNITQTYGEKSVLKDVSFKIKGGSKTAIIGPTAAGKTQLLYILTNLIEPTSGTVNFDGHPLHEYESVALHRQIGFVFQDSIVFNLSLRENIAFSSTVDDKSLEKAIVTAELTDFIDSLPDKLNSKVSERGTSLSGGQKQRLMLARALTLNPRILLLDDFTSRVDSVTEAKILNNVRKNYPEITLVSITQKVASVESYDQIILLMEGEVLASGTHQELLKTSSEYMQIYTSQQSTTNYEVHA